MSDEIKERILSFSSIKVLVIGKAVQDAYLGDTESLAREASIPVVSPNRREYSPGACHLEFPMTVPDRSIDAPYVPPPHPEIQKREAN